MRQYLDLPAHVLENGTPKCDRRGVDDVVESDRTGVDDNPHPGIKAPIAV